VTPGDVQDWGGLCTLLLTDPLVSKKVKNAIDRRQRDAVEQAAVSGVGVPKGAELILKALNGLVQDKYLCKPKDFPTRTPGDEVDELFELKKPTSRDIERRNRLFLESKCPGILQKRPQSQRVIEPFFTEEVARYLATDFPNWGWILSSEAREPVPRNYYLRAKTLAGPGQYALIDQLWDWVQQRRQMDLEFWFYRLARAWVYFHAPAAWVLLILTLRHVLTSVYYGGWL
jgi:hypothetical protein